MGVSDDSWGYKCDREAAGKGDKATVHSRVLLNHSGVRFGQ